MKKTFIQLPADFWQSQTAHQLAPLSVEARLLALYLLTSPHANMLGIYYVPFEYISLDTGLPLETIVEAMDALLGIGFCEYDTVNRYIWVCDLVDYRLNSTQKLNEKQIKAVHNLYISFPRLPFLENFYDRYRERLQLDSLIYQGIGGLSTDSSVFDQLSKNLLIPLGYKKKKKKKEKKKQKKNKKHSLSGKPDGAREIVYQKNTADPNAEKKSPDSDLNMQAKAVLDFLNEKTGRAYRPVESNLKLITARLRSGATPLQCRQVIVKKNREWKGRADMALYLRPATLFNATKFEQYVGELVLPPDDPSLTVDDEPAADMIGTEADADE